MALKSKIINSQKELKILKRNEKELITKAKYGPSKPTRIPLFMNEELSFLTAVIIGDGHLKKDKLQINIECIHEIITKHYEASFRSLFLRKFNIKSINRTSKRESYYILIDSKAIYNLFNIALGVPSGKKSYVVLIPKEIKNSSLSIKSAFLIGIMVTEGGKRRRGLGLSTASEKLWKDLIKIFEDVGIEAKIDKWIHKKYKRQYYGLAFKKEQLEFLMKYCKDPKIRAILADWRKTKAF